MTGKIVPGGAVTLACWLVLASPTASIGDNINAITRLKRSFARIDAIAWTGRQRTQISRPSDNLLLVVRYEIKAARNGDKLTSTVKQTGDTWARGRVIGYSQFIEVVFDGRQAIQINSSGPRTNSRKFSSPEIVPAPDGRRSMVLIGSVDGSPPFGRGVPYQYFEFGKVIFGYVDDFRSLAEVLAGATRVPDRGIAELPNCVPMEAVGPYGKCSAWLDSAHGFLPKRIEFRSTGRDIVGEDTPLADASAIQPGTIFPAGKRVEVQHVFDNIVFDTFEGKPVIGSLRETTTHLFDTGQQVIIQNDFQVEEFHSPESDAFVPRIKIPENMAVNVFSDPRIKYVWHDGAIIKDTTPESLRSLERLAHTPEQSRFVPLALITLNVLAIGALVVWIFRRRWRTL